MPSREDYLRKVRALVDKAQSLQVIGTQEAINEAEVAMKMADGLMIAHAIEQAELDMARPAGQREHPEMQEYSFGSTGDRDADYQLYSLFQALARLAGVKIGYLYYHKAKVVGYKGDLEYLDMMFTGIRLHMARTINPHVDPSLSFEDNLVQLKETGLKWVDIFQMLAPVFPHEFPGLEKEQPPLYANRDWQPSDGYKWIRKYGVRFTGIYTRYCKEHGRDRQYDAPAVYRRSFIAGYVTQIQRRVADLQRGRQQATSGKEVVLAGRLDDLMEFFYDVFPDLKPHEDGCDCDTCHRCTNPRCKRPRCVNARKPVRYSSVPERKMSDSASRKGRQAAEKADLTSDRSKVGGTKEIGQ